MSKDHPRDWLAAKLARLSLSDTLAAAERECQEMAAKMLEVFILGRALGFQPI